ncbi:MAG: hypothetical protein JOY97_15540 [Hyphomicrobiales bacterium]|nr:hypothetical protein [Hyphomicrobiales bacterium]
MPMSQDSIVSAASGKSAPGRSLLTSPHFNDARFVAASDKHNAARMSSFIFFEKSVFARIFASMKSNLRGLRTKRES